MNDFTINFEEIQDYLENEALGANEEGEQNISTPVEFSSMPPMS
ncbi:hypothetical protein [Psychromarinibacter halotolerans]|uniref:Uncharacterized protein n=1 Tax=Psychromarinibacter halotolerans TaxID=1775175 RepID=A0ABV7GUP4_9RHOB|nr:hypothetical protein [Psychromarinibacter halotolerans]MDF0595118.1 hypothetical protein [Psychromarinibacter halotolerans]